MLVYNEPVTLENTVIFHFNKRYHLYSLENKKLITDESFTQKKVKDYLLVELDAEDDPVIESMVTEAIKASEKHGHSFDEWLSAELLFKDNKCLKHDKEMSFDYFIAYCFQRGANGLYRCEKCDQVVRVNEDDESFILSGGDKLISAFCSDCNFYLGNDYA